MKLSEYIQSKIKLIEDYLKEIAPVGNKLYDAMSYSLLAGGKRVRPLITLLACEAMGGDAHSALPYAAAVEAVHTYSLVHDDLPAMDNDDLRRGMPTCHRKFGEDIAILAGDALLTWAFELISSAGKPEKSCAAVGVLASAAGMRGMVLGQSLDMEGQKTLEGLLDMYAKKTGALLSSSAALGVIMAGGRGDELDDYSKGIGLAFQIRDDILDVYGDEDLTGKKTNSDAANEKTTVLSFMSREKAEKAVAEHTGKAINSLGFLGGEAKYLKEIAMFLIGREG